MKIVSGVGLMLFDPDGKLMLLRETRSKVHYEKVAGMLSFPIETIEQGETNDQACQRLIVEEIGVPILETPSFFGEFMLRLNEAFTERLFVFQAKCQSSFIARPNDTDVVFYGWLPPQEILAFPPGQIRVEVEPVLSSYLTR